MDDLPDGVAIQPVFAIEAEYAPDAGERRRLFRATHLADIAQARRNGVIVAAGGYADMSGSLILAHVPDETAAQALVEGDIYWRNRIWSSYRIRPLTIVVDAV